MVPSQLLRRDRRNKHREVGFICVVSVYRALRRATCKGCTSGTLADCAHQGVLILAGSGEHEDKVWSVDARLLQRLLSGLTTSYVGIMMVAYADPSFDRHEYTSCLLRTHLSVEGLSNILDQFS